MNLPITDRKFGAVTEPVINARDLWRELGLLVPYHKWVSRDLGKNFMFKEGEDYYLDETGGDFLLTISMAWLLSRHCHSRGAWRVCNHLANLGSESTKRKVEVTWKKN